MKEERFTTAKPVWAAERENVINLTCVFKGKFYGRTGVSVAVTASCLYRVKVNGKIVGYGPARAAHGYFRVDRYEVNDPEDENSIEVEVAGYNTMSFYTLKQPSFLILELVRGNECLLATGRDGDFICYESDRLQKVCKFSYQRAFTEYYVEKECKILQQKVVNGGIYLERGVGYADMSEVSFGIYERGYIRVKNKSEPPLFDFLNNNRQNIYKFEELEKFPAGEIAAYDYFAQDKSGALSESEYCVYSSDYSETGFIGVDISVREKCKLYIVFDEVDLGDEVADINFTRNSTYNIIGYELEEGDKSLISFEVYTAKFIRIIVVCGRAEIKRVFVKRFINDFFKSYIPKTANNDYKLIFNAAARTFAHNSVDIFTDCPSRERAGWLCDAFFIGRAEKYFTGKNTVEKNFLENYALAPQLKNLPEGMIPMCYPSDAETELFIPNWALWYLVELYDYYLRTGDSETVRISKNKADGLLKYFEKFENEFGLLEDLKNWVFIEWSKANDAEFIKGVNYPSNMLYCRALRCVALLYGYSGLEDKAERIKKYINENSFNGEFFVDNAVRNECGKLTPTGNISETCQYYAFYFDIADISKKEELFILLTEKFGPGRNSETTYPHVYRSNAFIGNYLRFDLLKKYGYTKILEKESKGYFLKMAKVTGTLWEHDQLFASLDHGFTSYAGVLLDNI